MSETSAAVPNDDHGTANENRAVACDKILDKLIPFRLFPASSEHKTNKYKLLVNFGRQPTLEETKYL